ncbi:MAG: zinc ABC transporter substrate-binding protein [Phycisphaerales bacterium]
MRRLFTLLAAPLVISLASCTDKSPPPPTKPPESAVTSDVVLTTFYPTLYFADRIAGNVLEVECPLPPGEDPVFWTPSAEVIQEYQSARLVILNGAEFEKWALTAPLPRSRVVDTSHAFEDDFLQFENAVTHSHGPAGAHSHTGIDGHTWLDPNLAIRQARVIERAFIDAFPTSADTFAINLLSLETDLRYLDERFLDITPDVGRVRLLASHPAYNYIARRYNWAITNLALDPETPLSEEEVGDVLRAAGDDTSRPIVLLWESEPVPASRAMLEAAGVRCVVFSPGENPGPEERGAHSDYLNIMRANIDRLRDALDG